jgi:hypothetical protein
MVDRLLYDPQNTSSREQPHMSPHPIVRHILLQTVEGAPVSTAPIPTIRPGAVDPDTGANSPRDEDFKFRTIESLHEV